MAMGTNFRNGKKKLRGCDAMLMCLVLDDMPTTFTRMSPYSHRLSSSSSSSEIDRQTMRRKEKDRARSA